MKKRVLSLLMAALMCSAVFAGCTKGGTTSSTAATESTASQTAEKDELGKDFVGYPMKSDEELTFNCLINYAYAVPDGVDRNDNEWNKKLAEKVGVKINWESLPAGGDSDQAYNLMISSAELPDIFYYSGMSSKATQLIEDKKVIALNDYLETYAPAYYKTITASDARNKALKDDNGDYYGFAFLREDLFLGTYAGQIVRKDLLAKVGMDVPTTIDDWDKVLHAFKDQNLVKYPLSSRGGLYDLDYQFRGAYGSTFNFYVDDDNKVQYGFAQAGYKDYLTQLKAWNDDGLIDPDFLSNDAAALETKILNGEVGTCFSTGGTVTGYMTKLEGTGSKDEWVAAPYAVLNKGDTPQFIQGETDNIGLMALITTSCKNIPLACRLLDYGYTEEGMVFFNYGEEGVSFEYKDGVPFFTEAFKTDPRGSVTMMQTYTGMDGNSATCNMMAQFKSKPAIHQESVNTWYVESALKHLLPGSITMTTEESTSIATEMTAMQSYVDESIAKFVLGQKSLDEYDAYLADLKGMGLEHVLQVYQTAYDRFLAR